MKLINTLSSGNILPSNPNALKIPPVIINTIEWLNKLNLHHGEERVSQYIKNGTIKIEIPGWES